MVAPATGPRLFCLAVLSTLKLHRGFWGCVLASRSGLFAEELGELALRFFPGVGIGGGLALVRDVGPRGGVRAVHLKPLFGSFVGVGHNGLGGAFGFAHAAINALVGVDDEHVLAFVKAIHRAHFDAIHVFATNAGFGHGVGHCRRSPLKEGPGAKNVRYASPLAFFRARG